MCQINLFNLLEDNPTTGGTWEQDIQSGNSIVTIDNGIIETNGLNAGEYLFMYIIDNGYCVDSTTVTINIFDSIQDITIKVCTSDISSNIFTELVDKYLLQYDINLTIDDSDYSLSYSSGSPTSSSINLSTGDFNPSLLQLDTQYVLKLDLIGSESYCNCSTIIILEVFGCGEVSIDITDCVITYSSDCGIAIPDVVSLQEYDGSSWNTISTSFPYTITDQLPHTYRIEVKHLIEYPFGDYYCYSYSNEVEHECIPTICEDCSLSFLDVTPNLVGILECGNLHSPNCILGDYVIEWYLNDVLQFVTGNATNNDPDIEVFHPFTGSQAIPVIGGTYLPIIRYVEISGTFYAPTAIPNTTLSPDLEDCLNSITVVNPDCGNGNSSTVYSHNYAYTANTNFQNATRTIQYEISSDTSYLAYSITCYNIADRIKFIYVNGITSVQTTLLDVVIGADVPNYDFSGAIKFVKTPLTFKNLLELPTYVTDSYVKIEITPSYYTPSNQNTSWLLGLKCFDEFDCDCTTETTWNPSMFDVTCSQNGCDENVSFTRNSTCDNLKYLGNLISGGATIQISNGYFCGATSSGVNNCITLNGLVTYTKVSNVLTIFYTNITDYNNYKSILMNISALAACSDNTLLSYYNYYSLFILTGNNCGDQNSTINLIAHMCAIPVFDDVNQLITINLNTITNNYVPTYTGCDACISQLDTIVNSINASVVHPDFNIINRSISSSSLATTQTMALYPPTLPQSRLGTVRLTTYSDFIPTSLNCDILNCIGAITPSTGVATLIIESYRYNITDVSDACNNYTIEYRVPSITTGCVPTSGAFTLFYEIENGVQIFP